MHSENMKFYIWYPLNGGFFLWWPLYGVSVIKMFCHKETIKNEF